MTTNIYISPFNKNEFAMLFKSKDLRSYGTAAKSKGNCSKLCFGLLSELSACDSADMGVF